MCQLIRSTAFTIQQNTTPSCESKQTWTLCWGQKVANHNGRSRTLICSFEHFTEAGMLEKYCKCFKGSHNNLRRGMWESMDCDRSDASLTQQRYREIKKGLLSHKRRHWNSWLNWGLCLRSQLIPCCYA